jgi:hypothetical protein
MKRIAIYLIWLIPGNFALTTNAQNMAGFELDWSINLNYYQVRMADNYFDDSSQYIAYVKPVEGSHNDTLVLFDYKNKNILHQEGGFNHSIVRFVNHDRLLYYHSDTLFSIDNFNDPVITPRFKFNNKYPQNFILSPDKTKMVCLINDSLVHLYNYDITSNAVSFEKTYAINHYIQGFNLAMDQSNNYIAVEAGYERDSLTLIDLSTDEVSEIGTTQNDGTYSPVFFWQDSQLKVAVGGGYLGGNIDIIDVAGKSHTHNIPMFYRYNYSLDVDASSQYMVNGGYNNEIKLLNIQDLAFSTIDSIDTDSNVEMVKFSTDDKYIISLHGGGENKARISVYKIDTSTSTSVTQYTDHIDIYPNPVTDILTLEGLGRQAEIRIFDLTGKKVFEQSITRNQVDLSTLDKGVYILSITDKNKQFFRRTIIKY